MAEPASAAWYCVDCGVRLQPDHAFCWNCGAERWSPPDPVDSPPVVVTPPAPANLGSIQLYFAFWAVVLLAWATVDLAVLAAPDLANPVPVVTQWVTILVKVVIAFLHGGAYYGIRARRVQGWLLGVVLAGLWSLVLVGIPALTLLLRRSTREEFGLA
ncbi:MAG TPA: hypothetical protein VF137_07360 [Candidatus Dormibacteraeota bacterium]